MYGIESLCYFLNWNTNKTHLSWLLLQYNELLQVEQNFKTEIPMQNDRQNADTKKVICVSEFARNPIILILFIRISQVLNKIDQWKCVCWIEPTWISNRMENVVTLFSLIISMVSQERGLWILLCSYERTHAHAHILMSLVMLLLPHTYTTFSYTAI